MRYYDVFGESGFHSAFMTTYAFSAQAFEDVPFPKLRGAGCRNIAVLADKTMLNMSFGEYGAPRYAGALYHVAKVSVGGAFHPKLTMLIGADKGRLLIGSANLTALGLAGNRELVADIRYSADSTQQNHLFVQAINYIRRYVPLDDPWFPDALGRALRHAPWLREAVAQDAVPHATELSLLLDRPDITVLEQIRTAIRDDEIERLVVLSPYWDDGLEGLSRLRTVLGSPPTDILIDTRAAQFPAAALAGMTGLQLFDLKDETSSRFFHAKLLVALGRKWDHVIAGSMNCSLPALMGPNIPHGNAEAGIYKRVSRGIALQALRLDGYDQAPLEPAHLPPRAETSMIEEASQVVDGGLLELQGQRLRWTPPAHGPAHPQSLQLFDRDGVRLGDRIMFENAHQYSWLLSLHDERPRTAQVFYADGAQSVPTIVVDLDALHVRTLPPHRGKKRQFADLLAETRFEDLYLLQAMTELDSLDLDEQSEMTPRHHATPNSGPDACQSTDRRILTYENFVHARNRARAEDSRKSLSGGERQDRATDLYSACLNRLIGHMKADLSAHDEDDLQRQAEIDLRSREPTADSDKEPNSGPTLDRPQLRAERLRALATSQKLHDAISAFEQRTQALQGKRITTAELLRLRTLLQFVLSYARPASGEPGAHQILPIMGTHGDWPRLLGRLLRQHFGAIRALQQLDITTDGSDRRRVVEYLAMARFSAQLAVAGARAGSIKNPILKQLEPLAKQIEIQASVVLSWPTEDIELFREISHNLNERFSAGLGLAEVPPT